MDSGLFASHAEILAGRAECDDIDRLDFGSVDIGYASKVLHVGEALMGYQNGKRFDLTGPQRFNAAHGC